MIEKYVGDFLLFVEAGCTAVDQKEDNAALQLFRSAALLDQQSALPEIGIGYLHLCRKSFEKAHDHFSKACQTDSNSELAKTLCALSLAFLPEKQEEGIALLEQSKVENEYIQDLTEKAIAFFRTSL